MIVKSDDMMARSIELFKEKGIENITVQMICQEFNVTKGSFYHHFKSKEDLLLQWIIKNYREIEKGYLLQPEVVTYDQFKTKELQWAKYVETLGYELSFSGTQVIMMYRKSPESFKEVDVEDFRSSDVAIVQNLIDQGIISSELNGEELVRLYSDVVFGISVDWSISNGGFDIVERISKAFDFVYRKA